MAKIKELLVILFFYAISLLTTLFGAYLLNEKVIQAIQTGSTEERAGLIERASDPWFFWIWAFTYGLSGTLLIIAGISLFIWLSRTILKR